MRLAIVRHIKVEDFHRCTQPAPGLVERPGIAADGGWGAVGVCGAVANGGVIWFHVGRVGGVVTFGMRFWGFSEEASGNGRAAGQL